MYSVTVTKTKKARYSIGKFLIVKGYYIRIGKIAISIWED
jgi:hypothetical protein